MLAPTKAGTTDISVLLADDHPIARQGVESVLTREADINVIGAVGEARAAIREAERLKPRVLIMGISLPGLNGIEATHVITSKLPQIGVLILSTHSSPVILRRAIEAGARGYLAKDATAEELVRAVRAVAEGKRYIGQGLAQGLLGMQQSRKTDPALETLTTTELNILRMVADGKSNPEVAAALGLSRRTIETYRLRLMRKLGIDNLASLVRYAIKQGVVPLD